MQKDLVFMTKSVDFYFDIISPYAYLAYKQITSIDKKKIQFNYKPILLGGLHKLVGITAPAFNQFKLKNMKNDCNLIASKKKSPNGFAALKYAVTMLNRSSLSSISAGNSWKT